MSNFKTILLAALISGGLMLAAFVPVGSEQLIVTNKEVQSEFRCSGAFSFSSCETHYSHFVNGKHVLATLYAEVEEGKTYNCGRSIAGNLIGCKESEGEK